MKSLFNIIACATTAIIIPVTSAFAHSVERVDVAIPAVASGEIFSVSASCPSGHLTGGGFELDRRLTSDGPMVVLRNRPTGNNTWTVDMVNRSGAPTPSGIFTASAYAICTGRHR